MKNKYLIILLAAFLLFVPNLSAKTCEVIKGDGTKIGDEIKCGSEEFYVLSNDGKDIEMLAKYNLYVGDKIEKSQEFDDEGTANSFCTALKGNPVYSDAILTTKYGDSRIYFCRMYTPLEYTNVLQNPLAIGLYPNGNMEVAYPLYGITYITELGEEYYTKVTGKYTETFQDEIETEYVMNVNYYELNLNTTQVGEYIKQYKTSLTNMGYKIKDAKLISLKGLSKVISKINNKEIALEEEFFNDNINLNGYDDYEMSMLKNNIVASGLIPEKYKWIYGTTYWIGTAIQMEELGAGDLFLSTLGDLCAYGVDCREDKMGVGVRPVITIAAFNNNTNPQTGDNTLIYMIISGIAFVGIVTLLIYLVKNKNNRKEQN